MVKATDTAFNASPFKTTEETSSFFMLSKGTIGLASNAGTS
jgi:hypothetical protein